MLVCWFKYISKSITFNMKANISDMNGLYRHHLLKEYNINQTNKLASALRPSRCRRSARAIDYNINQSASALSAQRARDRRECIHALNVTPDKGWINFSLLHAPMMRTRQHKLMPIPPQTCDLAAQHAAQPRAPSAGEGDAKCGDATPNS
jgi:hypothetical protein